MLVALDTLPDKKLIADTLEADGEVCAIGAVGRARGLDMSDINPKDNRRIAATFGIPYALACELMFINDEYTYFSETPESRFTRMHNGQSD